MALASLEQALTLFEGLGGMGWAARTQDEIRRVGLHSVGRNELSATEDRVARLQKAVVSSTQ